MLSTSANSSTATSVNQSTVSQQQHMSGKNDLDSSSMSLSMSASNTPLQQLQTTYKRTFCFALVHSKSKQVTFYCFTTEPACYDSLKQVLDQAADTITQRHALVNNIVLYKLGGLIGDCLMYDIKKVSFFLKIYSK